MATPKHWQRTCLHEVLSECDDRCGALSVPVLSVTKTRGLMLASERFGRVMHGKNLATYRLSRRGTLVADPMLLWDGSIGIQDVVDAGAVSPDYRVYCVSDQLDREYLRNLIRSPAMIRRYQDGARGTNVRRNRITRGDFLAIPFECPPLPEQRKIAAILSSVDETIAKTESVIAQLQIVKKAMMEQLLTKGMPGRHTRFKQTEIGEIPEEWEVTSLASVVMEKGQYGANAAKQTFDPSQPRYVRITDIDLAGRLRLADPVSLDWEAANGYLLNRGDILIARSGATVGKSYLHRSSEIPCAYAGYLIRFRPQQEKLLPEFLAHYLYSPRYWRWVADTQRAQAQPNINAVEYGSLQLPLPNLIEQSEIVAILTSIDESIEKSGLAVDHLRIMKSALSSSLLSGEIRVVSEGA